MHDVWRRVTNVRSAVGLRCLNLVHMKDYFGIDCGTENRPWLVVRCMVNRFEGRVCGVVILN